MTMQNFIDIVQDVAILGLVLASYWNGKAIRLLMRRRP